MHYLLLGLLLTPNICFAKANRKLYGVTIDSISELPDTLKALKTLKQKPVTRIVFDEDIPASDYKDAVTQIHKVSFTMGELLDSYYAKNITPAALEKRTADYLKTLGDQIDIWEIGNEINGEWLGKSEDVVKKLNSVYSAVRTDKKKMALTLYYNEGCFENAANETFTWAKKNISDEMKKSLDYVLLSYYEDDCNGLQPDWPTVFKKLGEMFPNSKLGFGEVGTKVAAKKESYLKRYYSLKIDHPRFIGGYFWWYFKQDMTPANSPLLKVLNTELK